MPLIVELSESLDWPDVSMPYCHKNIQGCAYLDVECLCINCASNVSCFGRFRHTNLVRTACNKVWQAAQAIKRLCAQHVQTMMHNIAMAKSQNC